MVAPYMLSLIFGILQSRVFGLPMDIPNCNKVKPIFETRNISTKIPSIPIDGNSLAVCRADHSCCTSQMETSLTGSMRREYQALLEHNVQSVQGILTSTAIHFQDYVHQMLLNAEKKTLQILNKTFGSVSSSMDETVKAFYNDLNQYLTYGIELDIVGRFQDVATAAKNTENQLAHITDSLFVRIFPLIYQTTLGQKQNELHSEYKTCLQNKINDIKPFSDLTKGLEKDISRTFEAARVLITSLNFGSQLLNQSNQLILSVSTFSGQQCYEALFRMTYCSHCNGHTSATKPCSGYCINVMRGCLAQAAAEMDPSWNGFYEAIHRLISVVNRGQSSVCLADLLRSLHSRIAEPILHFSEQYSNVHDKVKYICGPSRWVNDSADSSYGSGVTDDDVQSFGIVPGLVVSTKLPGSHPDWKLEEDDLNFRSVLLSKKIQHFQESVPRGFYANLADTLCSEDSFAEKRESASCWNGERVAEYTKPVLPIALSSQKYNSELPWVSQSTTDPRITNLAEKLTHIKQMILNQIVTNPESDSLYQMNDYGSGSGISPKQSPSDQWTDDEDVNPDWQYSGSSDDISSITDVPGDVNHDVDVSNRTVDLVPVQPKDENNVTKGRANRLSFDTSFVSINAVLIYTTLAL